MLFVTKALAEEAVEKAVEEAVEESTSWFTEAFGKFAEFPVWGWLLVAVLLVGGVLLWTRMRGSKKTVWTTKMLSLGAICLALTCVLSMIKLFRMPQGGSVTPASMLPLMLFAYVYGVGPGMLLGALYGMMDFALGGWFLSVPQLLMDYPVAFAMCGLAGLFRKHEDVRLGLSLGVVVGSLGRYIAAVAAGILFWSDLTNGLAPALIYSLGYNGTYMAVECIICVVISVLLGQRLVRELKKVA
ncbi:MAG: energy-coupled thiamine transporter ThiT [Aristaeellaceae bacterium]